MDMAVGSVGDGCLAVGGGCLAMGGGCLAMGLVIVGLWWKGCVCCDCQACRVWVVPWVIVWCL